MRILLIVLSFTAIIPLFSQEIGLTHENSGVDFSQNPGIYFSFEVDDRELLNKISRVVSIDNVNGNRVVAYANAEEFAQFLTFNLPYSVFEEPADEAIFTMLDEVDVRQITSWDFYPTYEGYISMMNQFATQYPSLCQVFSIGTSVQGRQLMMAKISTNVSVREPEPQFLYTGTIHGDELTGYVLFLRLIDYLLTNYGTDPKVTYLLDNVEIWINPLSNPDGTYKGGNSTVNAAVRYNANNVDLNRNYPDPEDGPHPDGKAWQPETIAFMQLAENNNFVMAGNTHGGAEVLNYPWDTWSRLAADNNWWIYVCREYVDTVHIYSPSTYLDGFNNGITNGFAWYTIDGGRQDYMNYFHNCRELTMEISNTKKLSASLLPVHWDWNYRSLLNYIKQVTFGVAGTVTDIETGDPLVAEITIEGHDLDNSHVYSENEHGFYQRLLEAGTYNLTFTAPGYMPVTVSGVSVSRYNKTTLNVQLDAGELDPHIGASDNHVITGSEVDFTDESFGRPVSWQWTFQGGQPASSSQRNPSGIQYNAAGSFDVTLTITNSDGETATTVFEDFIRVSPVYLMSNSAITTCNGLFYDSGGASGNYPNNSNLTITFTPATNGAKLRVEFLEFSLEPHSTCSYDWLKIFDGANTSAPLIGTFCGANSPGTIVATNLSGKLTFQFKSDASATSTGWKALISCILEQQISLNEGWAGVSSNVQPINPDIETLTAPIAQDLILIKGDDGIYHPALNINTLETWNARRGYLIKLSTANQLSIVGSPVQNKTISLNEGWNLIPVLSETPVSSASMQSVLGKKLVMMQEVAGFGVYWPAFQIQTLQTLTPGKAYYLKVTESVQFTFPNP